MTKLHIDKLPPETRTLFEFLSRQNELEGSFVLIGGTAITLHHGHRQSEDLDFRATSLKLPRKKLDRLLDKIAARFGPPVLGIPDEITEEWENEGTDILDYQQNYTVGGVKLTFFADHDEKRTAFIREHVDARFGTIGILSSDALFELKARLIMHRTRLRDLFDLWFYLSSGQHGMDEVMKFACDEWKGRIDWEGVRNRLLPARQQSSDPGFSGLIDNGPQTFETLIMALRRIANEYEQTRKLDEIADRKP